MSTATLAFGTALILLGVIGYFATGMQSPTALIPAAFGIVLAILGAVARNPARRKMAMHIAVMIAFIGFLATARAFAKLVPLLSGEPVERPAAAVSQIIMSVLMFVFTALCVRSFVNARRNRSLEGM